MDIFSEIDKIKPDLDEMHDEKLIETVKTLLDFNRKGILEAELKPMSLEEYKSLLFKSESDIENQRITDVDEL